MPKISTRQQDYKKRLMAQRHWLDAYQRAGDQFLAGRLESVFKILETPEDVALHNDMIREINMLLMHDKQMRQWFILRLAGAILKGPGDLLKCAAGWIRLAANKGVPDGQS
jgi:hypothetical protein